VGINLTNFHCCHKVKDKRHCKARQTSPRNWQFLTWEWNTPRIMNFHIT
jgi:hypothetical protein